MKKLIFAIACSFVVGVSCKKWNNEVNTNALLNEARRLFLENRFDEAKQRIDSIERVLPKDFQAINAGYALLDSIRYAENISVINRVDSLLKRHQNELETLKKQFVFVPDLGEKSKGRYLPKELSKNDVLVSGVYTDGSFYIESRTEKPLRHNRLRVKAESGETAQTPSVTDDGANFRLSAGDIYCETVRYNHHQAEAVARLISDNQLKNISITLVGASSANYTLSPSQKNAIANSFALANLMAEADTLQSSAIKARLLIDYLDRKQAKALAERAKKSISTNAQK